jgi:hypothetical protein
MLIQVMCSSDVFEVSVGVGLELTIGRTVVTGLFETHASG